MTKTKEETLLPLPERVITWASAGAPVTMTAEAARTLARDAIRLRAVRSHVTDAHEPPAQRNWVDVAIQVVLVIAATQVIEWSLAFTAWLF